MKLRHKFVSSARFDIERYVSAAYDHGPESRGIRFMEDMAARSKRAVLQGPGNTVLVPKHSLSAIRDLKMKEGPDYALASS